MNLQCNNPRRQRMIRYGIYAIFAIFYFWLAAQIPYTDDDWDWGLPVGITQLVTASLNSRYAGNFLVVLLTRSVLLKTVVMGATFFLLPLTVCGIFTRNISREQEPLKSFLFIVCNTLLLSIERIIWKQTYSWVSGFCNYVVPMVFLALYLQEIMDLLDGKDHPVSVLRCAALFIMCAVMQLFIENLALFMVLLSCYICLVCWKQHKKVHKNYLCLLTGNLCGLGIMFSSSVYSDLFASGKTVGGYREMIVGGNNGLMGSLYRCGRQLIVNLIPRTWGNNIVISIVIVLLISWLMLRKFGKQKAMLVRFLVPLNGILAVYFAVNHLPSWENTIPAIVIRAFFNCIYFMSITVQLVLLYNDRRQHLHKILLLWFCIPGVVLPLAAVSECSHRLFLAPTLFTMVLAVILLLDVLAEGTKKQLSAIFALVLTGCIIVLTHYGIVYAVIGKTNAEQLRLVEEAKVSHAREIILPAHKYEDYLWYSISNVSADYRYDYFKDYYDVDPEVIIQIAPVS